MLKLQPGKGFRVTLGASVTGKRGGKLAGDHGVPVLEVQTAPGIALEFEIKLYDDKGLLIHVGKQGPTDQWGREDYGFFILPDIDRRKRKGNGAS